MRSDHTRGPTSRIVRAWSLGSTIAATHSLPATLGYALERSLAPSARTRSCQIDLREPSGRVLPNGNQG